MLGRIVTPVVIGPIVKSANWSAFNVAYDAPDWEGQFLGADVFVNTTIGQQATNYLTITAEKIANVGAGTATAMASINTSTGSTGKALTAARRNEMTLQGTTESTVRFAGRLSEPSGSTNPVLLNMKFTPQTGTVDALDMLVIAARILYSGAGTRA